MDCKLHFWHHCVHHSNFVRIFHGQLLNTTVRFQLICRYNAQKNLIAKHIKKLSEAKKKSSGYLLQERRDAGVVSDSLDEDIFSDSEGGNSSDSQSPLRSKHSIKKSEVSERKEDADVSPLSFADLPKKSISKNNNENNRDESVDFEDINVIIDNDLPKLEKKPVSILKKPNKGPSHQIEEPMFLGLPQVSSSEQNISPQDDNLNSEDNINSLKSSSINPIP
jgi:hypothetical protein